MAFRTRADLVLEALENLGVLAAGQTPAIEDTARIDEALPSLIAELAGREIVFVPDLENIPDVWFQALAQIVAYEVSEKFGVTGDDFVVLKAKNDDSINRLKAINRGRPTYQQSAGLYI